MVVENNILYMVSNVDINPDGTFTFPEGVIAIGKTAFLYCENLIEVVIPDGIREIGDNAFANCKKLKKITIPDNVISIKEGAFCNCESLTEIVIPNGITRIEPMTFAYCFNLEKVTIPYIIKEIGSNAFLNCKSLKKHENIYKGFSPDLKCDNYQFAIGEESKKVLFPKLDKRGYHYYTDLLEVFNDYNGVYDRDFVICVCEPGEKIKFSETSKCVTDTIKPVRKLTREEIIDIINGKII